MHPIIKRIALALAPLALCALASVLLLRGALDFGGGEKDVLLLVPLLVWSTAYSLCYCVLWTTGRGLGSEVRLSVGIATAVLIVCWVALFVLFTARRS
jgi:hypothetical protein